MRAIKSTFKKHLKAIKKKDRTAGTAGSITPSSNPDLNVATTDVPAMGIEGSSTHIHNNPETSLNPGLNVSTPDIPAIEVVDPSTVVSNDQQTPETPEAPNVGTATTDIPTLGVVGASTIAGGDEDNEDTPEILRIRRRCPRFRILIIGKANSGKTTILQKMCGTTDTPIVVNKHGRKINPSVLEDPTAMRGMHDIENEIFYPSNHGFVFHDSRGFEAGSVDEMDKVRNFIAQRSAQRDLKNRLHAIWFCVPMDSRRVLSTAELAFFEKGTGDVPVIVLFTKWDGQIVKSYSDLKQEGRDVLEAKRQAPEHAMGQFKEHYLPVITEAAHPPAAYVLLGNMHKQEASCSELTERTASAMSNGILSKLFISVQNTNIQISMQRAIRKCIEKYIPAQWPSSIDNSRSHAAFMVFSTALWFYHIYGNYDYGQTPGALQELHQQYIFVFEDQLEFQLRRRLDLITDTWSLDQSDHCYMLTACSATILAAHRIFFLKQKGWNALDAAITEYASISSRVASVKNAIQGLYQKHKPLINKPGYKCNKEALAKDLLEICTGNLLK